MLIIGSAALGEYVPLNRGPKDLDVMGTYDDVMSFIDKLPGQIEACYPISNGKKYFAKKQNTIIEAEIAWEGSTAEMFIKLMREDGYTTHASLNGLYALKMSHRYLKNSPHFKKTMDDIHLMRQYGAAITPNLIEFFKVREKETYSYHHPKLNVMKKDFFTDDGVGYVYDHDSIHEAVKQMERPAYWYFKPKDSEVMVSKKMFIALSERIKLNSVLEEAYVLAIERSQVPFPGILTPRQSFEKALMKVCTSITSGWWREYAWEHYYEVLELYSDNYINQFKAGVDIGIVKPIQNSA